MTKIINKSSKEQQMIADRKMGEFKYQRLMSHRYLVAENFGDFLTILLKDDPDHPIGYDVASSLDFYISKLRMKR